MKLRWIWLWLVPACWILAACGGDEAGGSTSANGGSVGVAQGGAQDFGRFRQLVDDGEIPGPETLDPVGFLNEHKIELPNPECDGPICIHGQLGIMGNLITGSDCTMLLIGLNSAVDPSALERPDLDLAVVVDTSGSMAGEKIAYAREGLLRMVRHLMPNDTMTLVAFADDAEVLLDHEPAGSAVISAPIDGLKADGATNVYEGLRLAYQALESAPAEGRQRRVLLVSDGLPTAGITSNEQIIELARSYAALGIGLSTIGLGAEFDISLTRSLAEAGAGSFYFVEDARAVVEVFSEEVEAFLVPLASDAQIDLEVDAGYQIRGVYGTRDTWFGTQRAEISLPVLQIAQRKSTNDNESGRRGGGGAIIVEIARSAAATNAVGTLDFSYVDTNTGETRTQKVAIRSPLDKDEVPKGGYFEGANVEKAFIALNVLVGLQSALHDASVGEDWTALATLQALETNLNKWLRNHPDADLDQDHMYLERLIDLLNVRVGEATISQPPEPWPID